MQNYLEETEYLNFNHPEFEVFFNKFQPRENKIENAIKLYEFVRDAFLYDPYHLDLRKEALQASTIIHKKRAWCVEKAIVLTACFRKAGIPARLGFAIVKNHIGVEKLTHYLRRPEIVFHG
jgi:transglutaminase-like putative cysteine protease